MRKEVEASILVVTILIFFSTWLLFYISSDQGITGKASSDTIGVSITVLDSPDVIIVFPENSTYLKTLLPLNFTIYNGEANNYSINDGANITLSSNTTATFTSGFNTLHLWANNSDGQGQTHETRNLTVNLSLLQINYTNFNGSTKGESTDFYAYPYTNLTNLSGIILENTNYGKIYFTESINVTNDSVNTDFVVNLNDNILILDDYAYINSSALSNFNKSARVYLYGLTFTDPRVLLDNSACPSTVCTEINYSGGTLVFTVNRFSKYSADETPSTTTTTSGGGGGGGGSGITGKLDINYEGTISLGQNEEVVFPITITNKGNNLLRGIRMRAVSEDGDISTIFENAVIEKLNPKESKTIILFVNSKENAEPKEYKISISAIVSTPSFTESRNVFAQVLGKDETEIKSLIERISTAKELFEDNPRCEEFISLLEEAENLLNEGSIEEAKSKTNEAIQNCKSKSTGEEFPLLDKINWKLILGTIIGIVIVIIIITLLIIRKRERK